MRFIEYDNFGKKFTPRKNAHFNLIHIEIKVSVKMRKQYKRINPTHFANKVDKINIFFINKH